MKIIAVGDIHMTVGFFRRISDAVRADLLILNGDLTNFGAVDAVQTVIEAAQKTTANVVAQFGNLDQPAVNDYLERAGLNLHNQARLIDQTVWLIGVGGSNITPFSTPSEFREEELGCIARNAYQQAGKPRSSLNALAKKHIPLILVSHAPPLNTSVDRLRDGTSVGSSAIRRFIEDKQPDLCICGHIHEAAGMDMIGRTPIYNPGMLRDGGWLEIDIINSELSTTLHDSI